MRFARAALGLAVLTSLAQALPGCRASPARLQEASLSRPGRPLLRAGGQVLDAGAQLRVEGINQESGAPVYGITVDLWSATTSAAALAGERAGTTVEEPVAVKRARPVAEGAPSAAAGWFIARFDSLEVGSYTARVRRIGLETAYWQVDVRPRCAATLRVYLRPAGMCLADCVVPRSEPRARTAELFTCARVT